MELEEHQNSHTGLKPFECTVIFLTSFLQKLLLIVDLDELILVKNIIFIGIFEEFENFLQVTVNVNHMCHSLLSFPFNFYFFG